MTPWPPFRPRRDPKAPGGADHPHPLAAARENRDKQPEEPGSNEPCSATGCPNLPTYFCLYTDRRHKQCSGHWCDKHSGIVDGSRYCRRHTGTIRAIRQSAAEAASRPLPDVSSRAPGLVKWISTAMNEPIRALLETYMKNPSQEQISDGDVVPISLAGLHTWQKVWQLYNHTGPIIKITIEVADTADDEVIIRVGKTRVSKGVPPWITSRRKGEMITVEHDARQRQAYYDGLLATIHKGIDEELEKQRTGRL